MQIQVSTEGGIVNTTLVDLFDALLAGGASEDEAEVVFETMLDEGRIRVVFESARAT